MKGQAGRRAFKIDRAKTEDRIMQTHAKDFFKKHLWRVFLPREIRNNLNQPYGDRQRIFLMGTPYHGNLGDQAIAFAGQELLGSLPSTEVIEVPKAYTAPSLGLLRQKLRPDDVVAFTGGGNFGDLYPSEEYCRQQIVGTFPEQKIVLLPQSAWFTNKGFLKRTISFYSKHPNVVLIAREMESYSFLSKNFTNKVFLTPDLVLSQYGHYQHKPTRNGVITIFRSDKEQVYDHGTKQKIIQELESTHDRITQGDTVVDGMVSSLNRRSELNKLWDLISSHELAITDRLHGLIFGLITCTPTLFLETNNRKLTSTYQTWLADLPWVRPWKPELQPLQYALQELSTYTPCPSQKERLSRAFDPIRDLLSINSNDRCHTHY